MKTTKSTIIDEHDLVQFLRSLDLLHLMQILTRVPNKNSAFEQAVHKCPQMARITWLVIQQERDINLLRKALTMVDDSDAPVNPAIQSALLRRYLEREYASWGVSRQAQSSPSMVSTADAFYAAMQTPLTSFFQAVGIRPRPENPEPPGSPIGQSFYTPNNTNFYDPPSSPEQTQR